VLLTLRGRFVKQITRTFDGLWLARIVLALWAGTTNLLPLIHYLGVSEGVRAQLLRRRRNQLRLPRDFSDIGLGRVYFHIVGGPLTNILQLLFFLGLRAYLPHKLNLILSLTSCHQLPSNRAKRNKE